MASRFFTDPQERIPVYEFPVEQVTLNADGTVRAPNVIYIRPRMNVGTKNKVQGAMFRLDGSGKTVELDLGANMTALLQYNILDWEGPDFVDSRGRKIPCTPENIALMVGQDPFIERVAEEIALRNKTAESPDPKSPATSGSTSAGAGSSLIPTNTSRPSESTTPISSSQSDTAGPPSKSTDSTPTI